MAEVDLQGQQDEPLANLELFARSATDEVLVAAAKLGDRLAFVELWARHSNTAFRTVYRITGNHEDAEDVIQDAWIKAYVHLNTFDGRAKFSTWLTRIAMNSALMILRRKRARPETSMEITVGDTWPYREIADQTKNVEELYARHERVERLRRAICHLQPTLRNVVLCLPLHGRWSGVSDWACAGERVARLCAKVIGRNWRFAHDSFLHWSPLRPDLAAAVAASARQGKVQRAAKDFLRFGHRGGCARRRVRLGHSQAGTALVPCESFWWL